MTRWLGKYRGTVIGPGSPSEPAGSLMVNVPEVMGTTGTQLALPCFPYTGLTSGAFVVPPPKAAIWVEFEGGRTQKPIWVGGFYATTAAPALAKVPPPGTESLIVQTTLGNALSITDVPGASGGIMLRAASGAMILINDSGIVLQDGKGGIITMAQGVVSTNPPNLVILK